MTSLLATPSKPDRGALVTIKKPEGGSVCLLVVDDREIVRQGMHELWRTWPGALRYITARDGQAACLQARTLRPDVAVIRDTLTNSDGSCLRTAIALCSPSTAVLLLTDRRQATRQAGRSVCGIVSLESPGRMLVDAVLAHAKLSSTRQKTDYDLNHRQRLVLDGLASGETNVEIARRLCLSCGTVKQDATAIYRRLGVHTRAGAVAEAGRRGWLS